MYTGFKHLHSFIPYALLALLLISVVVFAVKWAGHKNFTKGDKTLGLITLIFTHLQFVVGLVLYFISPRGFSALQNQGMEVVMKNDALRLYAVEHISVMLIAIILITVGYSRSKRATSDAGKFSNLMVFYLIGLVLALSRIPWSAWLS